MCRSRWPPRRQGAEAPAPQPPDARRAAVEPPAGRLAGLHAAYAGTYIQEDAYLSALAAGIAAGSVSDLPDTQAQQRAQIIRWRLGLEVLARSERLALPADLAVAGRGEIAPSALGGS